MINLSLKLFSSILFFIILTSFSFKKIKLLAFSIGSVICPGLIFLTELYICSERTLSFIQPNLPLSVAEVEILNLSAVSSKPKDSMDFLFQ